MRRYIIFAVAAPVIVWAGLTTIGGKKADEAGTAVFNGGGLLGHGLLIESIAAGLLAAYLTKGG